MYRVTGLHVLSELAGGNFHTKQRRCAINCAPRVLDQASTRRPGLTAALPHSPRPGRTQQPSPSLASQRLRPGSSRLSRAAAGIHSPRLRGRRPGLSEPSAASPWPQPSFTHRQLPPHLAGAAASLDLPRKVRRPTRLFTCFGARARQQPAPCGLAVLPCFACLAEARLHSPCGLAVAATP